jgi:uncharacterized membrane protein YphA (DoxX/SURF4 family)
MIDLLFVGVGWTDLALTLNWIAVGAFFMLSGYHKLFNAELHRLFVDELKGLGVPAFYAFMLIVVVSAGAGPYSLDALILGLINKHAT